LRNHIVDRKIVDSSHTSGSFERTAGSRHALETLATRELTRSLGPLQRPPRNRLDQRLVDVRPGDHALSALLKKTLELVAVKLTNACIPDAVGPGVR
jgi:hypothetical protein